MTSVTPVFPTSALPSSKTTTESRTEAAFLEFRAVLSDQYQAWRELPEEDRIRHQYLEKHGLSEIDLDNLPAQDRAAHEEKIANLTKQPAPINTPYSGTKAGDAMARAVITLQSVLETPATEDATPSERTTQITQD